MEILENIQILPLRQLLVFLTHDDKLNLRLVSKRLYHLITDNDSSFKLWTFNPAIKGTSLPQFVLESDKDFSLQVKDENFETGVKDLVKFISKPEQAARIIHFSIKLTTSSTDGPITELMLSLKEIKPKWIRLKQFKIENKFCLVFLDMPIVFQHCQDSLEHMELESVAFTLGDNLNFPNLSSLNLDSCEANKSKELIRRVSSQLEYLHLENYLQDFGLKLDLAEVLRSEKDAFKKLKVLKLNETEVDVISILERCHQNLTVFHLTHFNEGLDFATLKEKIHFKDLRKIEYAEYNCMRNSRIGYLLNRCTENLHSLHLIGVAHDLSAIVELKIKNFHWEMMAVPSPYDEELKHFHSFLSKCSKLERLSLVGYHNPLKEIANLSLPVFTLELAECTLESAVAIINAASDCLTTLIINFSSVLLHYCLSCPPFVCPNLDTIQVVISEDLLSDVESLIEDECKDVIPDSDLYLLASKFFSFTKYEIIREFQTNVKIRKVYSNLHYS